MSLRHRSRREKYAGLLLDAVLREAFVQESIVRLEYILPLHIILAIDYQMNKKKRLTSEEANLLETLKKIGFSYKAVPETINKFVAEHIELTKKYEPTFKTKYPDQSTLLRVHFQRVFTDRDGIVSFDLPKDHTVPDEQFIRNVKRTCRRISKAFKTETFRIRNSWIDENSLLIVIFVLKRGSRLGNYGKIRPYDKGMHYVAALYVDKKANKLLVNNIHNRVLAFFNLILQEETKLNFITPRYSHEISWNAVCKGLVTKSRSTEFNLVEIGFKKTDFATGDRIIIQPKDIDVRTYLEALLDQDKIFSHQKFDLSYIDYIKLRCGKGKYNTIKFTHTPDDAIIPVNISPNKDPNVEKVLTDLGMPIDRKIIDPNKIPRNKIIQQILISQCVSKEDIETGAYKGALKYLHDNGAIKDLEDRGLYFCYRNSRCKAGSFFLSKPCPICGKGDKVIRKPNGIRVSINTEKIKLDLKDISRKQKIKYRRLRAKPFFDNKFELIKLSFPDMPEEINLYLNNSGLYHAVLENFEICPQPLLILNFRGELKEDLNYIHQKDAADFIELLYSDNKDELVNLIKNTARDTRYGEKKEKAFDTSMIKLREYKERDNLSSSLENSRKGNMYEWLAFNLLSYIFPASAKWGGKSLPDGIIGIRHGENKKFIFWDAKRYDKTRLTKYARKRKGGVSKDIKYILNSIAKEDTYEEGTVEYYLFITSNTDKEDFLKIKQMIQKKIEKEKDKSKIFQRLKRVKFCCMNIDALIKLGSFFEKKENYDTLKTNTDGFELAFEALLNINEGYITQENIIQSVTPLIQKKEFIPDKTDHRD